MLWCKFTCTSTVLFSVRQFLHENLLSMCRFPHVWDLRRLLNLFRQMYDRIMVYLAMTSLVLRAVYKYFYCTRPAARKTRDATYPVLKPRQNTKDIFRKILWGFFSQLAILFCLSSTARGQEYCPFFGLFLPTCRFRCGPMHTHVHLSSFMLPLCIFSAFD